MCGEILKEIGFNSLSRNEFLSGAPEWAFRKFLLIEKKLEDLNPNGEPSDKLSACDKAEYFKQLVLLRSLIELVNFRRSNNAIVFGIRAFN